MEQIEAYIDLKTIRQHSGFVFRMTNYQDFLKLFGNTEDKCDIINEPHDAYGKRICSDIKEIMCEARLEGRIAMTLTPACSEDGLAVFRFDHMAMDDFGAVVLYYEFLSTAA